MEENIPIRPTSNSSAPDASPKAQTAPLQIHEPDSAQRVDELEKQVEDLYRKISQLTKMVEQILNRD
ncbi:hypothetical protein [Fimbriiglobus ruber]|uniref:hypothetical protein n=1 Tax=Fimbriiglobus ruber TaxID=1908690 RepID=UPI001179F199|nr:hypothetical protein [Fimbriiglobus ruber]